MHGFLEGCEGQAEVPVKRLLLLSGTTRGLWELTSMHSAGNISTQLHFLCYPCEMD